MLGAPLVSTLEAQPSPAVIFQDPPKHVDWLDKGWVNVSRTPEINVTFTDETNKAFAHNTTTTSDFTIGGSASNTVTATAEEGLPGIEETEDSLQVTAGMKYSYDLDEAKYKKSAQNYSLTIKASTGDDDLVGGAYQTISIWRYPILGQLLVRRDGTVVTDASGRSLHPYYELQIPGPVEKLSPPVAGRGLDWYQPLHENGNALSYPQRTPATLGGLVPIADRDVGAYQLPGDPAPKRQILANLGYALDPTTSSVDLDISATTGGGQDRKTENTVGWNLGDQELRVRADRRPRPRRGKSPGRHQPRGRQRLELGEDHHRRALDDVRQGLRRRAGRPRAGRRRDAEPGVQRRDGVLLLPHRDPEGRARRRPRREPERDGMVDRARPTAGPTPRSTCPSGST